MIEEIYQTKELDSSKQKNRPHVSTKSLLGVMTSQNLSQC